MSHPGWDNLSGERDAELRKNAPAVGVVSTGRGFGAGGPLGARHVRTSAGAPAPRVSGKERGGVSTAPRISFTNLVDRFPHARARQTPARRFVQARSACVTRGCGFSGERARAATGHAFASQRVSQEAK